MVADVGTLCQRLAKLRDRAVFRAVSAWAWLRAQLMGDDDANFAPDPLVWKVLVGALIFAAAIVIGCGVAGWGAS